MLELRGTPSGGRGGGLYDLYVPNCELKLSNQNPQVMIPRIYNDLPLKIKQIECDKEFIKSVNNCVCERKFYDLYEFFSCD
jgi:hypothetical protein